MDTKKLLKKRDKKLRKKEEKRRQQAMLEATAGAVEENSRDGESHDKASRKNSVTEEKNKGGIDAEKVVSVEVDRAKDEKTPAGDEQASTTNKECKFVYEGNILGPLLKRDS